MNWQVGYLGSDPYLGNNFNENDSTQSHFTGASVLPYPGTQFAQQPLYQQGQMQLGDIHMANDFQPTTDFFSEPAFMGNQFANPNFQVSI